MGKFKDLEFKEVRVSSDEWIFTYCWLDWYNFKQICKDFGVRPKKLAALIEPRMDAGAHTLYIDLRKIDPKLLRKKCRPKIEATRSFTDKQPKQLRGKYGCDGCGVLAEQWCKDDCKFIDPYDYR